MKALVYDKIFFLIAMPRLSELSVPLTCEDDSSSWQIVWMVRTMAHTIATLGVVELFALHLCCLSPHYDSCILLSMEIRRLGGLITPACSYMLSMNSCVPHRVIWGLLAFALCCIVDFGPCLLVCPGSSVGRASLCLDCRVSRVSWVRVPPRAAHFFFEKNVVLGVVELFALHLCCLSPHYDSCMRVL